MPDNGQAEELQSQRPSTQRSAVCCRRQMADTFLEMFADAVAERLLHMETTRQRLRSLEETAFYMGLSEDAVRDLWTQGKLKPVRPTRKVQFDIRDIDKLIDDLKKQ
jgi:hypothetical protein